MEINNLENKDRGGEIIYHKHLQTVKRLQPLITDSLTKKHSENKKELLEIKI